MPDSPRILVLDADAVPEKLEQGARVFWWSSASAPEGQLSVPEALERHMPRIRAELLAWAYELGKVKVLGEEIQEWLKAGDSLSMWWCSLLFEKHPKLLPGLYTALKLRALEVLCEEEACGSLHLVSVDDKLRASLERFCREKGRHFSHSAAGARLESGGRQAWQLRAYYALPALFRAILRFCHWLWTVKRRLPRASTPPPTPGTSTIATYFPNIDPGPAQAGRFRSRYWEKLHDALAPGAGQKHLVNWLFIRFPSPQYSLQQCIELVREFREQERDGASFHYLEEFLGRGDILIACRRYVRLFFNSLLAQGSLRSHFRLQGSHMDFWPYLGAAYGESCRGWRALERCLHRQACIRYVEWCGAQKWTIFPMENCPWERMLTQAVHEAGAGPVYGTQHSTIRAADFRYFDDQRTWRDEQCRRFQPERIYVNGRGAMDAMLAAGYAPEHMGMAEALRYMHLAGEGPAQAAEGEKRLLLVTGFFADETDAHLAVLAQAARDGVLDGLRVCIKPHPYLPVKERLARLFPQGCAPEILDRPLGDLLVPGTIVWASNSTTAALEAALRALPVMAQAAENDFDLCPLQGVPGLVRIRTSADVARALASAAYLTLPQEYLALDPALPRWRKLLDL
jgi:surface carbohydrate biosynthesis protein (TIGR04326 family)